MKKIIRFNNNAIAYSDIKNLDVEFSYSNQVFLDCIRAEILKVDYRLNNKIKWLVGIGITDKEGTEQCIEVPFTKHLRSSDIWDWLPNISEQCLEVILGSKEYVEAIDSNAII